MLDPTFVFTFTYADAYTQVLLSANQHYTNCIYRFCCYRR